MTFIRIQTHFLSRSANERWQTAVGSSPLMGQIKLIGAKVLSAKMLSLPNDISVSVEKNAIREANKWATDELKVSIRQQTHAAGVLEKSIRHDIRRAKGENMIIGRIDADYNFVGTVGQNKKGKNAVGSHRRRPAKY